MPREGQVVENGATGERVRFVLLGKELLVMDSEWPRVGHRGPPHRHPAMEERFTVLAGRAVFEVDGDRSDLAVGEGLVVPPGAVHASWNAGEEPVRLRIEFRPARRWAEFVERLFAGEDPLALLREFPDEIALP